MPTLQVNTKKGHFNPRMWASKELICKWLSSVKVHHGRNTTKQLYAAPLCRLELRKYEVWLVRDRVG